MENELEGLAEPVRRAFLEIAGEAVCVCHEAYTSRDMKDPACNHDLAESVGIIRAELIRLARENAELPTHEGYMALANVLQDVRNEFDATKTELAALRKRVAESPVGVVREVGGCLVTMSVETPYRASCKRVRLVEESV